MKKCIKWENLHKFVQSLADDPICDELLVLCDKILHVWISSRKPHESQKPGGRQMPGPRAVPNLQMPHPRDWQGTQMPRSCPGGMGAAGIDWCISSLSRTACYYAGSLNDSGITVKECARYSGLKSRSANNTGSMRFGNRRRIKGSFDPWQRSLFVPSVSSANTKEKGTLLAGKTLYGV